MFPTLLKIGPVALRSYGLMLAIGFLTGYYVALKRAEKAGIKKRVHPHLLRHTYGSHLAMAGVDLPTIKELMGHSDISTTMIYMHLHPEHLQKAVNKLSF